MKNKKKTGSYYTPDFLSEFVTEYATQGFRNLSQLSILEPSVGDGSFVKSFNNIHFDESIRSFSFTAIDKVKPELVKAQAVALTNRQRDTRYTFIRTDFLKFQKGLKKRFHLVVGNPPYIKKQLLNKTQQELCKEIHINAGLSDNSIKNIWTAFLVRCAQLVTPNGVLALILPADLLQVNYSNEIRQFLSNTFDRSEIFTFDDLLFECKGQDTVLLFAFKSHAEPGIYYSHIVNKAQLATRDFQLRQNNALNVTSTKWTHHLLGEDDLMFLHGLAQQLNTINFYCDSKPGIVTAANDYFIISNQKEEEFNLQQFTRPIIQKGLHVNGSAIFNVDDYDAIVSRGLPSKVLVFEEKMQSSYSAEIQRYFSLGREAQLPERYKCKKRNYWYVIPNISTVPQGFFFKRSHGYPKLLKNNADVLVTDSAYKVEMRVGHEIDALVYSFYNSLTLAFAELYGRYYGGGVLELTPSEFKSLPIPLVAVDKEHFQAFCGDFKRKNSINEILQVNDNFLLHNTLGLNDGEIRRVQGIYSRLIAKRLRKK